jgi:hypothetical protein
MAATLSKLKTWLHCCICSKHLVGSTWHAGYCICGPLLWPRACRRKLLCQHTPPGLPSICLCTPTAMLGNTAAERDLRTALDQQHPSNRERAWVAAQLTNAGGWGCGLNHGLEPADDSCYANMQAGLAQHLKPLEQRAQKTQPRPSTLPRKPPPFNQKYVGCGSAQGLEPAGASCCTNTPLQACPASASAPLQPCWVTEQTNTICEQS